MGSVVGARAEDALLVRGLAKGDVGAVSRLLEAHLDRLYGLLRLVLPTSAEVEAALCETFAAATRSAGEPLSRRDPGRWLTQLTLEQIRTRTSDNAPVYLRERRGVGVDPARSSARSQGGDPERDLDLVEVLEGITDRSLAVLIRTVGLQPRRALVLGEICGLDDEEVAGAIGCRAAEVRALKTEAVAALRGSLVEHARREEELKRRIAAVPYHLRPLGGPGPDGDTVIRGTEVYLEPRRPMSLMAIVRRFIERLLGRLRHRHDELETNDVGGPEGRTGIPEPTPTLRPFEKPKPTPSIEGFRQPELTPGIATYATPKKTPSTRRISNPRPLPAGVTWSSLRHPRRER